MAPPMRTPFFGVVFVAAVVIHVIGEAHESAYRGCTTGYGDSRRGDADHRVSAGGPQVGQGATDGGAAQGQSSAEDVVVVTSTGMLRVTGGWCGWALSEKVQLTLRGSGNEHNGVLLLGSQTISGQPCRILSRWSR